MPPGLLILKGMDGNFSAPLLPLKNSPFLQVHNPRNHEDYFRIAYPRAIRKSRSTSRHRTNPAEEAG